VERRGVALMIDVSFASASAELSAQVANAVADAFVSDHMEVKYEATRLGSAWLERRIADLRVQSEADQRAVVEFKEKNNIVDAGKGRLNEQQLAEVNNQLGIARVQTSEAKARLEQITALAGAANDDTVFNASLAGVLTNDNLVKLRVQYLELASRATEFEQKYGRDHLSVINLRTQMAQVRRAILDEFRRLAHSYESDYNLASTRETNLESELAKLIAQSETTSRASVKLRELENAAELSTALYENFRKRYMESVEQQSFPVPEARVLTRAIPPLKPEYKSLLKMMVAILGAGASLGAAIGLCRELMDLTYRTVSQVEGRLHVNCLAMVPHVGSRRRPTVAATSGVVLEQRVFEVPQGPISQVADSPLSRYAESLRSVKLAIDMNNEHKATKIVGVTSSLPQEGKSTIAASLAFTIGRSGAKVILLDCDLRNPTLTRLFAPSVAHGFAEVLCGDMSLQDALWTDRAGIVSFLPVVFDPRFFSTEVMASRAAKKLFERLRDSYDYVIADLPPLVPIVDTRATIPLIDASIFVIRWGSTKMNVVEHALGREAGIGENMLGVVLNDVDMKLLKSYDLKNSSLYQNANYFQYGQVD
jgi:polysaccharide biosynthesis transport protein